MSAPYCGGVVVGGVVGGVEPVIGGVLLLTGGVAEPGDIAEPGSVDDPGLIEPPELGGLLIAPFVSEPALPMFDVPVGAEEPDDIPVSLDIPPPLIIAERCFGDAFIYESIWE